MSKLTDHDGKECKKLDLVLEKLLMIRKEWNEDRMKLVDFINKSLHQTNEARTYNVDEAMLEYY